MHSCEPNQWVYAPSAPARPRLYKAVAAGAAGRGSAASREGEGREADRAPSRRRPATCTRRRRASRTAPRREPPRVQRARPRARGAQRRPPASPRCDRLEAPSRGRIRDPGLRSRYERRNEDGGRRGWGVTARGVTHQPGSTARARHCFTPLRSRLPKRLTTGELLATWGIRTGAAKCKTNCNVVRAGRPWNKRMRFIVCVLMCALRGSGRLLVVAVSCPGALRRPSAGRTAPRAPVASMQIQWHG